jgi:hypothetical protein
MLPHTPEGHVVRGVQQVFVTHRSPWAQAERPQSTETPQALTVPHLVWQASSGSQHEPWKHSSPVPQPQGIGVPHPSSRLPHRPTRAGEPQVRGAQVQRPDAHGPSAQSASRVQASPVSQGPQLPPQSTSVSRPLRIPSSQRAGVQEPPWHEALRQSPPTEHGSPSGRRGAPASGSVPPSDAEASVAPASAGGALASGGSTGAQTRPSGSKPGWHSKLQRVPSHEWKPFGTLGQSTQVTREHPFAGLGRTQGPPQAFSRGSGHGSGVG